VQIIKNFKGKKQHPLGQELNILLEKERRPKNQTAVNKRKIVIQILFYCIGPQSERDSHLRTKETLVRQENKEPKKNYEERGAEKL